MVKKLLNKLIVSGCYTQPILFSLSLVLGIFTPVKAQMYEGLNNFPSPQFNNSVYQPSAYNQSKYLQNFKRYMVYVDDNHFQTLQQVLQVEPTAYIRQFQRRYIIQAGVFSQLTNAQRRIRQLAANGINNTQIFSLNQKRDIPNHDAIGGVQEQMSRYYYVAIPTSTESAREIVNRIQQNTGFYRGISTRNYGWGYHVAVGPFVKYSDAQKWNNYLHNMGFGNAKVHYGR